jgi:hypothetical protein
MYKSAVYKDTYEKPTVCQALADIKGKFDWDEFAQVMSVENQNERKERLGKLYDNGLLVALRSAFLSQMQRARAHSGRLLEQQVTSALTSLGISFSSQVAVMDNKIISKRAKGCNILDYVVPKAVPGESLEGYILLSTKTSTRERGTMDHKHNCKSIYWITHDNTKKDSAGHIVVPRDEDPGNEVANLIKALEFLAVNQVSKVASHKDAPQTPAKPKQTKKKSVVQPTCLV